LAGVPAWRPFRFACRASSGPTRSLAEWAELAHRAAALGYDVLCVSDHVTTQYGPLPVLAAVAACDPEIRLGTEVLANDFRHPVLLAKEAATVDVISGGRLELGLGAGWRPSDYAATGIALARGGERVARLAEAVRLLRLLFSDRPATFAGDHYHVRELDGQPKPVQRPAPPLMIGGRGRRILDLAAREADIVSFDRPVEPADWTWAALEGRAALVRSAAGQRPVELHLLPRIWHVGRDRRRLVAEAGVRAGLSAEAVERSPHVLAGSADQVVELLLRLRSTSGISYVTIPSVRMVEFAPVVARLRGA
jgi:probable F420-dependent oxidoreductase